jgi:hypothetical protein
MVSVIISKLQKSRHRLTVKSRVSGLEHETRNTGLETDLNKIQRRQGNKLQDDVVGSRWSSSLESHLARGAVGGLPFGPLFWGITD